MITVNITPIGGMVEVRLVSRISGQDVGPRQLVLENETLPVVLHPGDELFVQEVFDGPPHLALENQLDVNGAVSGASSYSSPFGSR